MSKNAPGAAWGDYPERLAGQPRPASHPRDLEAALARIRAAFESTLGITPYPTQEMAARIMLDNCLAQMATGEGKTVAIAMAAALAAMDGIAVHVITANDYLAARDAQMLSPFYTALGLSCGVVTQPMQPEQRRVAWSRNITYCTAKELVFDYLRDGLTRPRGLADLEHRARRIGAGTAQRPGGHGVLLRGLPMAIVDEADTVLIDEAVVPLVLSQAGGSSLEHAFLLQAAQLASQLREGHDFRRGVGITLTDTGRARLSAWPPSSQAIHNDRRHREDTLQLALTALHVLQRDRDYVVIDGQVTIVDETTGRAAAGRAWSRGLHQLVEIKEGLPFTARSETVSQITYQRFFPRYVRLAGMSGTLQGAEREMRKVYDLRTRTVPLRLPSQRQDLPLALYPDSAALWQAVAERTRELHTQGRPVLIGTGTVAQSEHLSEVLRAAGLDHAVLNARQDSGEGAVIAAAGQRGRITVATSMAGRGTDIALGAGVAQLGGLHVILCQHNVSRRIDRQFLGRAARRGEPGSTQTMLAMDFDLMNSTWPAFWRQMAHGFPLPLLCLCAHAPQWLASYTRYHQRQALRSADEEAERALTFHRGTDQ